MNSKYKAKQMKRYLSICSASAIFLSLICSASLEARAITQQLDVQGSEFRTLAASGEPSAAKLSINSTYGDLLDNPVTKAVLVKLAPEVVNNPQSQMGRSLAFKDLAQYEPTLTPDKLKAIDAALATAQK
jgi:hypothetical protein